MSDPHVLVVDDDPDVRDALEGVLVDAGFQVSLASDGREALAWLARRRSAGVSPPDLVLLDWMMPHLDGGAVRRALLGHPDHRGMPVVFLTADPRLTSRAAELQATVLVKPCRLADLLQAVRAALSRVHETAADAL